MYLYWIVKQLFCSSYLRSNMFLEPISTNQ